MKDNEKDQLANFLLFGKGKVMALQAIKKTGDKKIDNVTEQELTKLTESNRIVFLLELERLIESGGSNHLDVISLIRQLFNRHKPKAVNKAKNKKLINTGRRVMAWEDFLKNSLVGGENEEQTANRYQEKKEELIASEVWTQIDDNGQTLEQILASCLQNIIDIQDATIEDFFERASNKPLYANTRVDSGTAMVENIKTNIGFDVHTWGNPINVDITYAGGGYSNDNFSIQGDRAEDLELLGIGKSRLFVLQNLARFTLTEGHKELHLAWEQIWDWNDFEDTIEAGNLISGMTGIIYNFIEVIGTFFGHITAMHVLTDFGGWVKCDLHLVRSINYLTGSNYPDVPNIEQACEINLFCIQFLKTLYPNSSQMKKDELLTALRELDFMLLNISRQGLIPEIDNN